MSVVIGKSIQITNRDAQPLIGNYPPTGIGMLREVVGNATLGNGDSIGSRYIFAQIPSNARVSRVLLTADKCGTTAAVNIGLYTNTISGGTVVNATFFASALSISAAVVPPTDITYSSTVNNVSMAELPLWAALGLAADPGVYYDVCAVLTAASDATAPNNVMSLKVVYVQ